MWRDRWFTLGVIGVLLSCLACLTPFAAFALGILGLAAFAGHLDVILLPLLVVFAALALYRYRVVRRRAP